MNLKNNNFIKVSCCLVVGFASVMQAGESLFGLFTGVVGTLYYKASVDVAEARLRKCFDRNPDYPYACRDILMNDVVPSITGYLNSKSRVCENWGNDLTAQQLEECYAHSWAKAIYEIFPWHWTLTQNIALYMLADAHKNDKR